LGKSLLENLAQSFLEVWIFHLGQYQVASKCLLTKKLMVDINRRGNERFCSRKWGIYFRDFITNLRLRMPSSFDLFCFRMSSYKGTNSLFLLHLIQKRVWTGFFSLIRSRLLSSLTSHALLALGEFKRDP
jgi:hypothetical protein